MLETLLFLDQGWQTMVKSEPLPVFVNKNLKHSHHAHLFTYCLYGCFPAIVAETVTHKAQNIYFLALHRKFADPCLD